MARASSDEGRDLSDVQRRIRNILAVCPASTWELDESRAVLAALEQIVACRQTVGDVISISSGKPLC